jgi:putative heme-binding domain-containing protein
MRVPCSYVWSIVAVVAAVGAGQQMMAAQAKPAKKTPQQIMELHTSQAAKPGTAAAGRKVFDKACAQCHTFGALGAAVGPDLTTINSRFKKRDILESIVFPSKTISDQYESEIFETAAGDIINGLIVRETAAGVQIRTATALDKPVVLPKGKIKERRKSTVSFMPEGLLDPYTDADVANLLAFLQAPPPAKK